MPDHDNHIDVLLTFLHHDEWKEFHRSLTALVAERDALRKRVEELEAEHTVSVERVSDLIAETWRLQKRVAELEQERDALRIEFTNSKSYWRERAERRDAEQREEADRDLRERLVCAALTGLCGDHSFDLDESVSLFAVAIADRTLDAMRKGDSDGK